MAISAGAIWRVRIGGSNTLCSGLFDPTIAGAGTDYTEQDTAQLALTDLASATPYTTITSATGGFTSAMIGNGIYIASGTGFTAGRYVITAVTNTNTAVVDRTCATAAASAGVANLGGAMATIVAPSAAGAVAGNVVLVRGQGSNDPVDIDYPNTYITAGANLNYVGYNGRPKVSHNGRCFYGLSNLTVKHFFFVQTAATNLSDGVCTYATGSATGMMIDCVLDTNGVDAVSLTGYGADRCSFINTGAQSLGTKRCIANSNGGAITNCLIKDQRFDGAYISPGKGVFSGNIVQNCLGWGVITAASTLSAASGPPISNNTIYGCSSGGIYVTDIHAQITNNIVSNCTESGAYGIFLNGGVTAINSYARISGNNLYGNNTNCNTALGSLDTTLDPQFANAPVDLTPTNTALRTIGGVGAL